MSKVDIDELVHWRDTCEALTASLQRKVRHCDEITEERDKAQRERDEARAEIAGLPAWQKGCEQALADLADAEEAIARLYTERDEARAELSTLRKDYDSVLEANVGLLDDAPWADVRRAYIRGAEAMRDAAANALDMAGQGTLCDTRECEHWGRYVRALPIPEET